MTDSQLRSLELLWKRTGDLNDEVRYLLERLRVGGLLTERLELAAYCGQKAAKTALDPTPLADPWHKTPTDPRIPDLWYRGLLTWGHEVVVRAGLAVTARVLLDSRSKGHDVAGAEHVFEAVESWLACPCEDHSKRARDLREEEDSLQDGPGLESISRLVDLIQGSPYEDELGELAYLASLRWSSDSVPIRSKRLREAVAEALVPWALGNDWRSSP